MRFGDERESSNFEDATGRSGGFGGGFGGGGLGCLLPLVASRFGIGGVVVVLLGYFLLSSLGVLGGGGGGGGGLLPSSQQSASAGKSTLDPNTEHFMRQVLADTEDTWARLLEPKGIRYTPTTLVAYSAAYQSGCGAAQSAMGPFYCPTDKKIYLDTEFFSELSHRFQAPGDFAQAYVIAHEVGHHVQDLMGTLDQAHELQARCVAVALSDLAAACAAGRFSCWARAGVLPGYPQPGRPHPSLARTPCHIPTPRAPVRGSLCWPFRRSRQSPSPPQSRTSSLHCPSRRARTS